LRRVVGATVLVVTLRSPALPVAIVASWRLASDLLAEGISRDTCSECSVRATLIGLFGVAVALGTLGRAWSGPATLLAHLDLWGTAVFAAVASVLLNNLPAASLLAARVPGRPYALLVGSTSDQTCSCTGSLAWLLWLRSARNAGAKPSDRHRESHRGTRGTALDCRRTRSARPQPVRGSKGRRRSPARRVSNRDNRLDRRPGIGSPLAGPRTQIRRSPSSPALMRERTGVLRLCARA